MNIKVVPHNIYYALLYRIKDNSRKILSSNNPESLHDLRVNILKLEFVVKIFPEFIRMDKKLREELKSSRQKMGKVRDLDILLSNPNLSDSNVRKHIELQRRKIRQRLIRAVKAFSYKRLLKNVGDTPIHSGKIGKSLMAKKLFASFKKVLEWKKQMNSANDVHKTRIALKELRYMCEFSGQVYKKGLKKPLRLIAKFQNILGKRQDAVAAVGTISKLAFAKSSKNLKGFIKMEKNIIKSADKKFDKTWKRDARTIQKDLRSHLES
jgi:CHAD domain-containing protein